jgi:hypothetical protein
MSSSAAPDRVDFSSWLSGLTLSAFINLFLHIKFRGRVIKWTLFPLQKAMCQAITVAAATRESVFWLLKARQVGGTEIIAAWCLFMCLARPGYSILVLSKTGGAAQDFIEEKLLPMLRRLYEYAPHLPWPSYTRTKSLIRFSNGSRIEAINSANHAGRGKTVDAVVMDEAGAGEFEHHAEDIFQSVQGTTEHGSSAFMIVMGTSAPGTWFNRQSEAFYRRATPGIFFFFLSMAVFPWRDPATDEGKAWWAKRVAQLGEVGARQEYPQTPEDAFLSKSGFVFPHFESPKGRHIKRLPIDWTWLYLTIYDHGRTKEHPAALLHLLYNPRIDHLHQFGEQIWEGEGLDIITRDMVSWREELVKTWAKQGIAVPKSRALADTAITADDGRQTIRDIIYKKTSKLYYFQGAKKHDEKLSLDWLIARINENRYTVDPDCVFTINQISHLLWDTKKSRYGKPVDLGNDCVDDLRYACAEIEEKLKRKPPVDEPIKAYSRKGAEYRAQHSVTKATVPPTDPTKRWMEH